MKGTQIDDWGHIRNNISSLWSNSTSSQTDAVDTSCMMICSSHKMWSISTRTKTLITRYFNQTAGAPSIHVVITRQPLEKECEEAWRSRSSWSHLDLFLGGFRAVGLLAGHDAVEVLRFAQQDLDLEPMQEHVFRNDPICYTQTETKGVHNKECGQMKNKLGKIMSPWLYGQADP